MTITELNNSLETLLKKEIKRAGHYATGNLYNKVDFNCLVINGDIKIQLSTPEYLVYLDKGRFWDNFISSDAVSELIADFIGDELLKFE